MRSSPQTQENRTITVDFQNEATYVQLLGAARPLWNGDGFYPLLGLSAQTQGDVSGKWVPDPPLALCARPAGRGDHLAHPVHHVPSGLRFSRISSSAIARCDPRWPAMPWWPHTGGSV